jgi:hypothetical protein
LILEVTPSLGLRNHSPRPGGGLESHLPLIQTFSSLGPHTRFAPSTPLRLSMKGLWGYSELPDTVQGLPLSSTGGGLPLQGCSDLANPCVIEPASC